MWVRTQTNELVNLSLATSVFVQPASGGEPPSYRVVAAIAGALTPLTYRLDDINEAEAVLTEIESGLICTLSVLDLTEKAKEGKP